MRIGIGLGWGPDGAKAAGDAARQAKRGCPRPDVALAFGSIYLDQRRVHAALSRELDAKILMGGSSYAEISPAGVTRGTVGVLLLELDGARVRFSNAPIGRDSRRAGSALAHGIGERPGTDARALGLLFGSIGDFHENEALAAIEAGLGRFPLFGGLTCGDYDLGMADPEFWTTFQYTGPRLERASARLALLELPRDVKVAFGFEHGWEPVGPVARLTRCVDNKVYEVDGKPVFDYYRQFLGDAGSEDFFELMIQRFAFALQLEGEYEGASLVKVPVTCDFKKGWIQYYPSESLQGRRVRLILANRRGLVAGARQAARRCREALGGREPAVVLAVSCCTRKAILHSRAGLEVEAVQEVFGPRVPVFGFYAAGEIAPFLSRYEHVVDASRQFSGTSFHGTTSALLALGARGKVPRVPLPKSCFGRCGTLAAENETLRAQLARSESVLDDSEAFLANLSRKSYEDSEKLKRQTEVIHRYTPHDVWSQIGGNAERGVYELADRAFKGAFLFMDVKGFTSFSEGHAPKEVVPALNAIFEPATRAVYDCGGDVDKYIGDCLFAAFRRPRDAVEAARRLLEVVAEAAKAGSPFAVRIGVNAGRAVRANVGSSARREYTFIGDAVNTAQRLEAHCEPGRALVAASLEKAARARFASLERREIAAKGKAAPVVAFLCSL